MNDGESPSTAETPRPETIVRKCCTGKICGNTNLYLDESAIIEDGVPVR